ncbi:hypothetical protein JQ633_05840 [Bradyrhizobium tropiciagri]|uniref:hypothetical protein n=1 Tax=Bradyrhizobium tropiciagri TaxID=312253 RepID=UPI001BAB510E|nr:hypothetical protein [Bradyrhizobium tropiciagri]MBR0869869.1 hypothetical protein [Bradyrhizobium tropiciagri]
MDTLGLSTQALLENESEQANNGHSKREESGGSNPVHAIQRNPIHPLARMVSHGSSVPKLFGVTFLTQWRQLRVGSLSASFGNGFAQIRPPAVASA